jgi:hypothetical protein
MPAESEPLLPEQIELIRRWIAGGGKFDGATASQPLALAIPPEHFPPPPEVYAQSVPITAVCFIDEGRHLVSGGYHELLFWNTEDASLVRRIENIGQRVFALAVSPDRQTLAVGCGEPGKSGEVRLVDCASGKVKGIIARSDDVVLDIAYRPGSHELAVASADSSIRVIDVETQLVVRTIASHADWVTAVAWSDDGTRLASASRDKSAKVHDAVTGDLLASYLEHGAAVRGVLVLADNKQIVSVGADNRLHRWDIDGVKRVATVALGGEGFKMVRNQSELFVPCSDHRLLQINLETNQISQEFKGHDDWVLTACYAPSREGDGGFVASGSFDGQVRVWDTADARLIRNWNAKP